MDDPALVRRREAAGDLLRDLHRLACGQRAALQSLPQGLAVEQLADQVGRAVRVRTDVVDDHDVGVAEASAGSGLLLEAAQTVEVAGRFRRQHLDGNGTPQARVTGAVDDTHAPGAEPAEDLVGAQSIAGTQSHGGLSG